MKRSLILFSVLLLSGCGTITTIEDMNASSWKKVALIVDSGNMLRGSKVGTTVFNNEFVDWEVSGLDLDSQIRDSVSATLVSSCDWTVDDEGIFVEKFIQAQEEKFNAYSKLKVEPEYLKSVHAMGYDGLIVYVPTYSYDDLTGTNQGYSGIGVFQRTFVGLKRNWYVVVGKLMIYDLDNLEIGPAAFSVKVTEEFFEDFEFKENWNELSEESQTRILASIKPMLEVDLPKKLSPVIARMNTQEKTPEMGNSR